MEAKSGKRGNRPCGVLGRDLSGFATYQESLRIPMKVISVPADRDQRSGLV